MENKRRDARLNTLEFRLNILVRLFKEFLAYMGKFEASKDALKRCEQIEREMVMELKKNLPVWTPQGSQFGSMSIPMVLLDSFEDVEAAPEKPEDRKVIMG